MDKAVASEVIGTVDARSFGQEVLQGKLPIAVEFMFYSCSHCGAVERPLREIAPIGTCSEATDTDLR